MTQSYDGVVKGQDKTMALIIIIPFDQVCQDQFHSGTDRFMIHEAEVISRRSYETSVISGYKSSFFITINIFFLLKKIL